MSLYIQSNTQAGPLLLPSASDLTNKEGLLVALGANGVDLPAADGARTPFVINSGAIQGEDSEVIPLTPDRNVRVIAKGTGSRGDVLVLADVGTAADKGKVRALPATTGTYYAVALAEEDFVDGQLVLSRPIAREAIAVA